MRRKRANSRRRVRLGLEALEPRAMLSGNMVFDDEFNLAAGAQPLSSTWRFNTGISANNSNVNYTDTTSTLQVVSDAGATDGKALAMSLYQDPNNSSKYLGARIDTTVDPLAGNWQYGHIEARIKLPGGPNGQGVGIWPAFWMLGANFPQVGWPNCGEVDIMENKGSTPGQVQGTIHGPGYSGGSGITAFDNLPSGQSFYSAYHLFAVDWGPNFVNFLVDGQLYASRSPGDLPSGTNWVFNHPFYIILDIQEGGAFAGGQGPNSVFPQTMLVDYVRAAAFPLSGVPALSDMDIGSPGQAGFSNFDGLAWTVRGSGSDVWNTSDQFHFTSESYSGDFTITARLDNLLNTGTFAKAGLMIRDGTAANATYAFVFANPPNGQSGDGVNFELRSAAGASSQATGSVSGATAPRWLRLQRVGNSFSAFQSLDGVAWTQLGPTESISMNSAVNVGLAVSANNNSALNASLFRSVSIVPAGWSDADIGSPGAAGFAAFDPGGGVWTLAGGGTDIWSSADQFNFVSQALPGDGTVVARVSALANTSAWAKGGVMLRNDETPGSPFADVVVTPGNGVSFQWRGAAGGAAASTTIGGISAPAWVRLTRLGDAFSGYYSTDGTTWTQIGATQTIAMGTTLLAGLAVTAHDDMALDSASFTNVAVLPTEVSSNSDNGAGSLRQAVLNSLGVPGGAPTVRFALPTGMQTINLLTPPPAVTEPLALALDSTQHVIVALPSAGDWNNTGGLAITGPGSLALAGAINGGGDVTVGAGVAFTADEISGGSLVIGGAPGSAATVMLAASDAAGNPLVSSPAAIAADSIAQSGSGSQQNVNSGPTTNRAAAAVATTQALASVGIDGMSSSGIATVAQTGAPASAVPAIGSGHLRPAVLENVYDVIETIARSTGTRERNPLPSFLDLLDGLIDGQLTPPSPLPQAL